jgi:hypothetical protein
MLVERGARTGSRHSRSRPSGRKARRYERNPRTIEGEGRVIALEDIESGFAASAVRFL